MASDVATQRGKKLRTQLDRWQDDLVNLTKRNKLLRFRHTKTASLEIVAPSLSQVVAGLERSGWNFFIPSIGPDDDSPQLDAPSRSANELETSKVKGVEVLASLRSLERTSNQTMLDTGLWVLYLGIGMLKWIDPSDDAVVESPLLLQPVALRRPGLPTDFKLEQTGDDAVINPALALKLGNDFGIPLPSVEDHEGTVASLLDKARVAVKRRKGWTVEDRVVLTTFTFHKDAMYRDLRDNRDAIEEHPLVQLAAIGADAGTEWLSFDLPRDEELDSLVAPEHLVSIRDADSTQRKCIIAARDGRSFVMDGPPGTGKSQTITNIIAELLYAGRSVLFVSEKAPALEVVSRRLGEAGLSDFVLELYDHTATRKEVAAELGRVLEERPRARGRFGETDRQSLVRLRKELNDYAIAVNVVREPLGRSLHQVVGRVLQLKEMPHSPAVSAIASELTASDLDRILDAAARLGRAWKPVEEGDQFLWRSLRDHSFSVARAQHLEGLVDECMRIAVSLSGRLGDFDAMVGLGAVRGLQDAERVQRIMSVAESHSERDRLPTSWLCTDSLDGVLSTLDARRRACDELNTDEAAVDRLSGGRWRSVARGQGEVLGAMVSSIEGDRMPVKIAAQNTASDLSDLGRLWVEVEDHVELMLADAHVVADAFQLDLGALSVSRARALSELASFIGTATPPEQEWLDPLAQATIREASEVLKVLVDDFRRRAVALSSTFTEAVLELDLVNLRARLRASTGVKKLTAQYRADKKLLGSCVVGGRVTGSVILQLDEAVAWAELRSRLSAAEAIHAATLGRYYGGVAGTDLERLDRALGIAERALALCSGQSASGLAAQLAVGAHGSHLAAEAGRRLAAAADQWETHIAPRLGALDPGALTDDLAALEERCRRLRAGIDGLIAWANSVAEATGMALPILQSVELARTVDRIAAATAELSATGTSDCELFGPRWLGAETDFEALRSDVAWAERVRAAVGAPLDHDAALALQSLPPIAQVVNTELSNVTRSWGSIAELFEDPWRRRLSSDFGLSFDAGLELLADLRSSIADIEVWSRYVTSRAELVASGFGPLVDFMEQDQVSGVLVEGVVERAVLESWVEQIIAADARLKVINPLERNMLVERFQELDRALVANAAASVINACAERRPTTRVGVAGIIQREAQKRSRHMPIRVLLSSTGELTQVLKPCFVMSPLTVSTFLPSDFNFDVVIFDEASQVKPGDAINCVYRGRQLIVAGDPKQLPPTNFFDQVAEEGTDEYQEDGPDDFESVLDVFLASGLPALSLKWHYRSQHESLITYSNYGFYGGKLLTFPGAIDAAPDVGVELVRVDGVYRRGGARDNPIEAEKVVDRVLYHRRHHPMLTVGVVAFSSAQQSAIEAEIERRLEDEPELMALVEGTDRLDGFFVKNLENVQGDERDIIIFSIGYGPDEKGKFTEQLGPLGRKGGERRLNVAITRARRRVEVVSSVSAGHFPGTSTAPGIRHLQRYLDFADRGPVALALDLEQGGSDTESVFEEMVLQFVTSLGYSAVPQVGVAGYRIDLGIRHPERPGEFVLGVECDGAAYHSSAVARDRDRLRQEILEGLGWKIHRIWGPSWFRDRVGQEAVLSSAIADAVAGGRREFVRPAPPKGTPKIVHEYVDLDAPPSWVDLYAVSQWIPTSWYDTASVHAAPLSEVVNGICEIVGDEGPIHHDVLIRRLASAYGVKRVGERIKESFEQALATAKAQKRIDRVESDFFVVPGSTAGVRVPDEDDDSTKRTVAQVPPSERRRAIEGLVTDSQRVTIPELRSAFSRLFGWRRTGLDIEAAFDKDLKALIKAGLVVKDGKDTVIAP